MSQQHHHPILKWFGIVSAIIILAFLIYFGSHSYKAKLTETEKYLERQKNTRHILIDKIGTAEIYLVVYNGDTLGVVSVK